MINDRKDGQVTRIGDFDWSVLAWKNNFDNADFKQGCELMTEVMRSTLPGLGFKNMSADNCPRQAKFEPADYIVAIL